MYCIVSQQDANEGERQYCHRLILLLHSTLAINKLGLSCAKLIQLKLAMEFQSNQLVVYEYFDLTWLSYGQNCHIIASHGISGG